MWTSKLFQFSTKWLFFSPFFFVRCSFFCSGVIDSDCTVFLDAFPKSVLWVSWQDKREQIALDSLVVGQVRAVALTGLQVDVTSLDFGLPVLVEKNFVESAESLFENLFARSVCDVRVVAIHELQKAGSDLMLNVFCGNKGGPVFMSRLPLTHVNDCSFVLGDAQEGGEDLLTLAVYDGQKLLGSATIDLRAMPHVNCAKTKPPTIFSPLMRMGERVCWVQLHVVVSLEADARAALIPGFASAVLPWRVSYGDVLLFKNNSVLGRILQTV